MDGLHAGDRALATDFRERAERPKKQFNEQFWLPDRGYYAIARDRDKRPVDAFASNMGHCLWSGIVDEDKARHVADRLMSPEMFSGWVYAPLQRTWEPTSRLVTIMTPSGRMTTR